MAMGTAQRLGKAVGDDREVIVDGCRGMVGWWWGLRGRELRYFFFSGREPWMRLEDVRIYSCCGSRCKRVGKRRACTNRSRL